MNDLIQSVLIIALILTGISVVLAFVLGKVAIKSNYGAYIPFALLSLVGLVLLLLATIIEKVDIMGAGFGGWGIACMFAATIGFIITSILDAYAHAEA